MNCLIPAKTFLLGEYLALTGGPALVLNTAPLFSMCVGQLNAFRHIHPESPAGLFWGKYCRDGQTLSWTDPYDGMGGLGASSAQFLGAYILHCQSSAKSASLPDALDHYYEYSWSGKGLKPSGYDVIAQSQSGIVFIEKNTASIQSYPWIFDDLSFFIVHSGSKLATHTHLQQGILPSNIDLLYHIVMRAHKAIEQHQSLVLLETINDYHAALSAVGLVASQTQEYIKTLSNKANIKALKGCGALGADTILILCEKSKATILEQELRDEKHLILANEHNLTGQNPYQNLLHGRL